MTDRIPLNRIVAFAGPFISVLAGGFATWLVARANVLGIEGLDEANVATQVAGALTFILVAVLSWLGQSRWLTGVHVALRADAQLAQAALDASRPSTPLAAPPSSPPAPPPAPLDAPLDPPLVAPLDPPLVAPLDPPLVAPLDPPFEPAFESAPDPAFEPPPDPAFEPPPDPPFEPPLDPALEPEPADDLVGDLPLPTIVDAALPEDDPAMLAGAELATEPDEDTEPSFAAEAAVPPDQPDEDGAPADDAVPDGTPDELRPVMPSEVPPQGEPDEEDMP